MIPADFRFLQSLAVLLCKGVWSFSDLEREFTNTVRAVTAHTNKISALSTSLELGSIIYGDPEFDVKANYLDAEEEN